MDSNQTVILKTYELSNNLHFTPLNPKKGKELRYLNRRVTMSYVNKNRFWNVPFANRKLGVIIWKDIKQQSTHFDFKETTMIRGFVKDSENSSSEDLESEILANGKLHDDTNPKKNHCLKNTKNLSTCTKAEG